METAMAERGSSQMKLSSFLLFLWMKKVIKGSFPLFPEWFYLPGQLRSERNGTLRHRMKGCHEVHMKSLSPISPGDQWRMHPLPLLCPICRAPSQVWTHIIICSKWKTIQGVNDQKLGLKTIVEFVKGAGQPEALCTASSTDASECHQQPHSVSSSSDVNLSVLFPPVILMDQPQCTLPYCLCPLWGELDPYIS